MELEPIKLKTCKMLYINYKCSSGKTKKLTNIINFIKNFNDSVIIQNTQKTLIKLNQIESELNKTLDFQFINLLNQLPK